MSDATPTEGQSDDLVNYEELTSAELTPEAEERLLRAQTECSFIWANREGWPVGLTMSFLYTRGSFWLTTSGHHKRVAAVRRDPRVSLVISSLGSGLPPMKTVTYKGLCTVHDDRDVLEWFLPEFAASLGRGGEDCTGSIANVTYLLVSPASNQPPERSRTRSSLPGSSTDRASVSWPGPTKAAASFQTPANSSGWAVLPG